MRKRKQKAKGGRRREVGEEGYHGGGVLDYKGEEEKVK
jgi:hypothetical protein